MPEELTPADIEVDEQFRALMEGLRTTIPGVMVLFSFLLALPLQTSFADIGGLNTVVFYTAFLSSAVASVLLIAPSVHQRVRAPFTGIRRRAQSHVQTAVRLTIAGTVAFLIAVASVVFLVSSIVFSNLLAAISTSIVVGVAGWGWFYLPLVRFARPD